MKKKARKLNLSRETLRALDLGGVLGGIGPRPQTEQMACNTVAIRCNTEGGGSDGGCFNTQDLCSNGCETGGACTVNCSAGTSCC